MALQLLIIYLLFIALCWILFPGTMFIITAIGAVWITFELRHAPMIR